MAISLTRERINARYCQMFRILRIANIWPFDYAFAHPARSGRQYIPCQIKSGPWWAVKRYREAVPQSLPSIMLRKYYAHPCVGEERCSFRGHLLTSPLAVRCVLDKNTSPLKALPLQSVTELNVFGGRQTKLKTKYGLRKGRGKWYRRGTCIHRQNPINLE